MKGEEYYMKEKAGKEDNEKQRIEEEGNSRKKSNIQLSHENRNSRN